MNNFNIKSKHGCSWHGVTMKSKWKGGLKQSPCLWGLRCHIMVMEWTLTIKITCDTLLGLMKVILSVQILLLEVGNKSISVSLDELKIIQKCLNTGDGKKDSSVQCRETYKHDVNSRPRVSWHLKLESCHEKGSFMSGLEEKSWEICDTRQGEEANGVTDLKRF